MVEKRLKVIKFALEMPGKNCYCFQSVSSVEHLPCEKSYQLKAINFYPRCWTWF